MAYDEGLADRVRGALLPRPDIEEKKMFGGLAFMVGGHMCCGVIGDDLMVRRRRCSAALRSWSAGTCAAA